MISRKLLFLLSNVVWLNILDILTTWIGLRLGAVETNHYLLFLGMGSGLVLKIVVTLAFVVVISISLKYAQEQKSRFGRFSVITIYVVLLLVVVVYTIVIVKNIQVINLQIQDFRRVHG